MSIQSAFKTAVLLAIGLFLAACSADSEPVSVTERPASPPVATATAPPATSDRQPATNTPSPTDVTEATPELALEPTAALLPADLLPDLGLAPDIKNEIWLNADRPLNLAALQGKVVLIEFWTYG